MHDVEEIAALLHIHEKAMGHGLALSNIRDMAWNRLQKLNADHAKPPTVVAPPPKAPEPDHAPASVADLIHKKGNHNG